MNVVLVGLALALGFVLGWLAHRRISLKYKERWLQAIGMLNAKALEDTNDPSANIVIPINPPMNYGGGATPGHPRQYIAGKWAMDERHEDGTALFYAIRNGFDDVLLGSAKNFERYKGLYHVTRSNADEAIVEMNKR